MELRVSEKHGVNPAIEQCFVCMKDKGVVLFGKLKGDVEAPYKVCLNQEPCDECRAWMERGVILISVDASKTEDPQNPYRTGGWAVVVDRVIEDYIQPPELAQDILKRRMAFVPDDVWDALGLPREGTNERE